MGTAYQNPIASDCVQLRAELGTALLALSSFAGENLSSFAHVSHLKQLQEELREPFLFMTVGASKAGKSSLLNALFGNEFCRMEAPVDNNNFHVFKFGEQPGARTLKPHLTECRRPASFLRDFNVVDAPGTEILNADDQAMTDDFAAHADLTFCVFSVVNPWEADAWQWIEQLPRPSLEKTVFVLQQADLRAEREVEAVCRHLRQTVRQKLGRTLPIFPVSAKKALLSKTNGIDKKRLWAESHFGPLEDYISETLGGDGSRRERLRAVCRQAQSVLAELAARARERKRWAVGDFRQLDRCREVTSEFRRITEAQTETFRENLERAVAHCQQQGEQLLAQRLRFSRSLALAFEHNTLWQREFHRNISSMIRTAITGEIEGALKVLENELNEAWEELEALQTGLSPEARRGGVLDASSFDGAGVRLVEEIEITIAERMAESQVEQQLRTCLAGGWFPIHRRRKACGLYSQQMQTSREELTRAASILIQQAISDFHQKLNDALGPLAAFCHAQEQRCQPLLDRTGELETRFEKIAARL